MKFRYVCLDCGAEFVTDDIMYLCPKCGGSEKPGEFRRGVLSVIYDEEELKSLKDKESVSFYDFFPYEINNKDAYPVGGTPLVRPIRLSERYGMKGLNLKLDSQLPSGAF